MRRPTRRGTARSAFDVLEVRQMLDASTDTGAVVTGLTEQIAGKSASLVVSFSEPLDASSVANLANYAITAPGTNGLFRPGSARSIAITSASLDSSGLDITLGLARPLISGTSARVVVRGTLRGADGVLIDGDNDQQPSGDYVGLFARGRSLGFTDAAGDRATVRLFGPGTLELTRLPSGDATDLRVVGAVDGKTTLAGSVVRGVKTTGVVNIPQLEGMLNVANHLPYPAFNVTRTPDVATAANLPYTIQVQQVSIPDALGVQSAVSAQSGGNWLVFGGRTNGLHGFDGSPGTNNFPAASRNTTIEVIDPTTGAVSTLDWASTGLPTSITDPLTSTNQEYHQVGNTLYVIGGYGQVSATGQFVTFDTLTTINVPGLIRAVLAGGNVSAQIRQVSDPRLRVTGGELDFIGSRAYLVFGQDFEGAYTGDGTGYTQTYTDSIGSFQIVDRPGKPLGIANYAVQVDPVNYRRRDGNLGPTIAPNGQPGLAWYGGVFTPGPEGTGYQTPVRIGSNGLAKLDTSFLQDFNGYTSPVIPLYSARAKTMNTVFLGGIGFGHYDPTTGTIVEDTNLPFTPDITAQVRTPDGLSEEYSIVPQLPARLGAGASFFANPSLSTFANGVIRLDALKGPTTLGFMYGGIFSDSDNTFAPTAITYASASVFRVTLVPTGAN